MVERLLLGSAGEYCDLELAVEVRRRKEEEEEAETETEACQLTWGIKVRCMQDDAANTLSIHL